jgi:hypothetical protein
MVRRIEMNIDIGKIQEEDDKNEIQSKQNKYSG